MLNYRSYICARSKIERDINEITYRYDDQIQKCDEKETVNTNYCYLSAKSDYGISAKYAMLEEYGIPEIYHEYRFVYEEDLRKYIKMRGYLENNGRPDADKILRDLEYVNMLGIPKRLMDRLDTKYSYGKIEKFLGECFCEK